MIHQRFFGAVLSSFPIACRHTRVRKVCPNPLTEKVLPEIPSHAIAWSSLRPAEPIYDQVVTVFNHLSEVSFAMEEVACLPTLEELKKHVHVKLCERDHLEPKQTPLREAVICRRGKACGLLFHVQGPRLLKNYAVWSGEENRILFYNSSGERVFETRLSEVPSPDQLAG
jgi:hypothetical protein